MFALCSSIDLSFPYRYQMDGRPDIPRINHLVAMSVHKVLSKWTKSLAGQSNYLNLLQKSIWKSLLEDNDTAKIIESYALQVVCSFGKNHLIHRPSGARSTNPRGPVTYLSTQRNVTPSYIYHCLIDFKDGGDRTEFIYHQSKYIGPIYKRGAPFTPWYQLQAMGGTLRAS